MIKNGDFLKYSNKDYYTNHIFIATSDEEYNPYCKTDSFSALSINILNGKISYWDYETSDLYEKL